MNKSTRLKKGISCIVTIIIIGTSIFPATGQFTQITDEEDNLSPLETLSKRVILVSDTHWGGREYDGIAGDDIQDCIKSMKYLNPDYILHLGDVTELGRDEEFVQAYENFSEIIESTNVNHIWSIGGGAHDGLVGYISLEDYFNLGPILRFIVEKFKETKFGERIYELVSFFTQNYRYKFYLGFYQILNQTSQWYTLKIGNNVFVMVGYFHQPAIWASGEYGGCDEANLLNMNKVNWLNQTLAKWNGTGNNIFICHHFPLHHTNIYTHKWSGLNHDRFVNESKMIMDILSNYTDVVAWLSGHVHVDSNATYSSGPGVSKGTAVSGASRPDLPDHVHFINCGNVWKEHGMDWVSGKNGFASFRHLDLMEEQTFVDIKAWDSTNNRSATMTVNDTEDEVSEYRIQLPYPISNIDESIIYEQAWDVYDYCELEYQWYKDSEGLRRDCDGWIESRWDFWEEKDFSNAILNIDTSDPNALDHKIYYSLDGMNTWSNNWYAPNNLTSMPSCRWIKIITNITTTTEIFIRDISFDFP
ncbi:MAG: metallophosphoesterase [Thermoplasmatales archaeon]|nr:metallophosphoesterase [Thermoplasmatales archaeon]